jgi:hypothetical protein
LFRLFAKAHGNPQKIGSIKKLKKTSVASLKKKSRSTAVASLKKHKKHLAVAKNVQKTTKSATRARKGARVASNRQRGSFFGYSRVN